MVELLSISEAASELQLHPSRVRAMVGAGSLPAIKIGNRWAVDRRAVLQLLQDAPQAGRPFEPRNAWAIVGLAAGERVEWIDPSSRWRLREALALHGLAGLRRRLRRRADMRHFRAHPGELKYLIASPGLVLSGISAADAHRLGLIPGDEVDAYVRSSVLRKVEREHALDELGPLDARGNVVLRVIDDGDWPFKEGERFAPLVAVALDLADDPDARSRRLGLAALERLDRERGTIRRRD